MYIMYVLNILNKNAFVFLYFVNKRCYRLYMENVNDPTCNTNSDYYKCT